MTQAMHFNFVPADPRFMAAAISFVVDGRGCGSDEFHGLPDDAIEFLEMFQCGDVGNYPEFFTFCERQGLPVVRSLFSDAQRPEGS